jgi:hypothetical protein
MQGKGGVGQKLTIDKSNVDQEKRNLESELLPEYSV